MQVLPSYKDTKTSEALLQKRSNQKPQMFAIEILERRRVTKQDFQKALQMNCSLGSQVDMGHTV